MCDAKPLVRTRKPPDTVGKIDEADRPVRPWLTVIVDDHSRAVPGYTVFLGDPTALQTALALRQAIWRKTDPAWPVCGLPAALYSDHGSEAAQSRWRAVNAPNLVALVRAGATFHHGDLVERPTGSTAETDEVMIA